VICFTGDGGFWYHLSELEPARRHNINTVTIINNNGGMAQGIDDIHNMYGDRSGNPGELYRFESVNFARIAEEMGCLGIRVENPDEIGTAIKEALEADKPVLIEVITDINCRAPVAWSPDN
jgi:acetolactate synthase-1/2/3 large subunit